MASLVLFLAIVSAVAQCGRGADGPGTTVLVENVLECKSNEFACHDGKKCIRSAEKCDMLDDCEDGSDEGGDCDWFVCSDGHKTSKKFICDGISDCSDGSDEEQETANCTWFQCPDGHQISELFLCDGYNDCGDDLNSDECHCETTFKCNNSKCIENYLTCDEKDDCGDGSDEADCEKYRCLNGNAVEYPLVCNGEDNCGDATDECPCDNSFTCTNSRCVLNEQLCDGKDDCGDTSDECGCINTFTCDNGNCILEPQIRDGVDNCGDGSDENPAETTAPPSVTAAPTKSSFGNVTMGESDDVTTLPPTTSVPPREKFTCANGNTIAAEQVCNGVDDCTDDYRTDECDCEDTFECSDFKGHSKCIPKSQLCDGVDDCMDGYRTDECECPGSFTCSSTFKCVGFQSLCDGVNDCGDGSDELPDVAGCEFDFTCDNDLKVPWSKTCDGKDDCQDGFRSDECECDDRFLCDNGKCIENKNACDGIDDCGDCSDEIECGMPGSDYKPFDFYTCPNGTCIRDSKVCDGYGDCTGGEDEFDCDYEYKDDGIIKINPTTTRKPVALTMNNGDDVTKVDDVATSHMEEVTEIPGAATLRYEGGGKTENVDDDVIADDVTPRAGSREEVATVRGVAPGNGAVGVKSVSLISIHLLYIAAFATIFNHI